MVTSAQTQLVQEDEICKRVMQLDKGYDVVDVVDRVEYFVCPICGARQEHRRNFVRLR